MRNKTAQHRTKVAKATGIEAAKRIDMARDMAERLDEIKDAEYARGYRQAIDDAKFQAQLSGSIRDARERIGNLRGLAEVS